MMYKPSEEAIQKIDCIIQSLIELRKEFKHSIPTENFLDNLQEIIYHSTDLISISSAMSAYVVNKEIKGNQEKYSNQVGFFTNREPSPASQSTSSIISNTAQETISFSCNKVEIKSEPPETPLSPLDIPLSIGHSNSR